ncbi:uncharacterized protein A4U43_C07F29160 [Asparagus officinalis]|uniref:Uncharacterized protein n=1 Tax=Asparagus officinalis TaxID=4686 RepID=A0A5P1EIV0_ASPOF|nr:uncharacterized protein A4U43_C07F29160 [Asparagus officinalis]
MPAWRKKFQVRVNLPNGDMMGHIGEMDATVVACEAANKVVKVSRPPVVKLQEPTSSGNFSDEDETQAKTNDSLSSHEDISKQDTLIQQDQIMVVPHMNSEISGSISSVEQAIQVFLEESKDQVLCVVSPSAKVQPPMPGIYHIKSRDEISELQYQDFSIHVPLIKVDKKQSDEAPPTPVIDDSDDIGDEGPVDSSMSSVADVLLPMFVKEFCEQKPLVLFEQQFEDFIKLIENKIALCGAFGNSGGTGVKEEASFSAFFDVDVFARGVILNE